MEPGGAKRDQGFSEQYFAPGVSKEFARELIAFNKEVAAEDDILTDSVQRGLLGGLPDCGQFLTNSEHLVIHFQKLIVNATGAPAALMPAPAVTAPVVAHDPTAGFEAVVPVARWKGFGGEPNFNGTSFDSGVGSRHGGHDEPRLDLLHHPCSNHPPDRRSTI